eukprot:753441-Hanusia_phi.AAC.3
MSHSRTSEAQEEDHRWTDRRPSSRPPASCACRQPARTLPPGCPPRGGRRCCRCSRRSRISSISSCWRIAGEA